jgi:PAS domain S-box-containing protein
MQVTSSPNFSELTSLILKHIPFGIFVEGVNRKVEFMNDEFKRMFELSIDPEDFIGADSDSLFCTTASLCTQREQFLANIKQLVEDNIPQSNIILELKNGKLLSLYFVPLVENGEDKGYCWCFKDISERIKLNREFQKQKEFYENILNSIPADIAVFNEDQYIFLNSSAISKEEIRDLTSGKCKVEDKSYHQHSVALSKMRHKYFSEAEQNVEEVEWEEDLEHPDGVLKTMLRKFHPNYSSDGLNFIVGYGVDISHVKNQAKKLREEEYKSKTLLNQLKEIVITINRNGFIESLNPAWEKVTEFSIAGCIGENLANFIHQENIREEFKENLKKEDAVNLIQKPFCIRSKSGNYRWLEGYSSPLKNESGCYIGSCFTFNDITDRRKADEDLLSLVKKERELNDLKSQFVNMVSHEVRTPLAGILSSVELLEIIHRNSNSTLKSRSFKHFSSIKEQVIRMGSLMDDVLLLGKIEAGKMELNLQETDLVDACASIITPDYNNKDFKVSFKVYGDPFVVKLDWNLIKHVLANLVSNAIKYSEGKRSPKVKLIFNEDGVRLKVKDYGIGIPKSELNKLFTSFTRASNVGNIDGTGLGLMLSKHFVEMHGGTIDVKSEEGKGAQFTVFLPIQDLSN